MINKEIIQEKPKLTEYSLTAIMCDDVKFSSVPMDWIEEDLQEIVFFYPETTRLQLLSADPFVLRFDRLNVICDLVHKYLSNIEIMTIAARVDTIKDKSVEELKILKDKGIVELNLGDESGGDETLKSVNKGYTGRIYWINVTN